MKTILPWVLVVILSVVCVRMYLAKSKLESEQASLAAAQQPIDPNSAFDSNAITAEVESDEIKNLRKDHDDLLRLRNEVRQLRDSNQQLEIRARAAAAENARREASDAALRDAQEKVRVQAKEQAISPRAPEVPGGTVGLMLSANGPNPGQVIVNGVATNSPAGRAGIPAGARLVSINGISMEGSTLAQSVQLIRGDEGSQVIIEYEEPQSGVRKQVALTREKVSWGLSN